jgi:hypothetical protein
VEFWVWPVSVRSELAEAPELTLAPMMTFCANELAGSISRAAVDMQETILIIRILLSVTKTPRVG